MKRLWKVVGVVLVALMVFGTTAAGAVPLQTVEHCPDGWLIKWEIQENGSVIGETASGVTGWFSISTSGGYNRNISGLGSGDYTLTGFCVKASTSNTGILPMSALPYNAGEHDISHVVVYGTKEYQTCDDTVAGEKVFGDWYQIGEERWNDWIEDGDIRYRTGSKLMARDWYQNLYDARDQETICDVLEGTQKRGQLMKEEEEKPPCVWMYKLIGVRYPCFLKHNEPWHWSYQFTGLDTKDELPSRYDGTDYMYRICALYDCTENGWEKRLDFEWTGKWTWVCETPRPCTDCSAVEVEFTE